MASPTDRLSQTNLEVHFGVSQDTQQKRVNHEEPIYFTDGGGNVDKDFSRSFAPGNADVLIDFQEVMESARCIFIKTNRDIGIKINDSESPMIPIKAYAGTEAYVTRTPGSPPDRMGLLILQGGDVERIYITNLEGQNADVTCVAVGTRPIPTPATLALTMNTMWFVGPTLGPNPVVQKVTVKNTGDGTLAWAITNLSTFPAWLAATPFTGAPNDKITVNVTTTGGPVGSSYFDIQITAAGSMGSPQTLRVWRIVQ